MSDDATAAPAARPLFSAERWKELRALLETLADSGAEVREAELARVAASDAELAASLRALLADPLDANTRPVDGSVAPLLPAAPWEMPATRIVALFGCHTNPRLAPTLQGSTLTSVPLSTRAVAICCKPFARSVNGSIGRCLESYGKRMPTSRLSRVAQQLVEFICRASLKLRSLQLIGHAVLQRMNVIPIVNFDRKVADQFEFIGSRKQSRRWHDFTQCHVRMIHPSRRTQTSKSL